MIETPASASVMTDAAAHQNTNGMLILIADVNVPTLCNVLSIGTLTLNHAAVSVILLLACHIMFKISKLVNVSGMVKRIAKKLAKSLLRSILRSTLRRRQKSILRRSQKSIARSVPK
jgi:hypothetical protein